MNVLITSQCSKRALTETRRILDHFAERKGERTWFTAITQQGLETLRLLLRKSARRNTAIACHWIKSGNRTELLWIIGNQQCFNECGAVPTNKTSRDILRAQNENLWHTIEDVSLLSSIAGLFHDIGKANQAFQKKLKTGKKQPEPYRHEWVSLRLFEAFVRSCGTNDVQWLEKLVQISNADEMEVLDRLELLQNAVLTKSSNPLTDLPPLAQAIGWLIVSHHRLPHSYCYSGDLRKTKLLTIEQSLTAQSLSLEPNSWWNPYCQKQCSDQKDNNLVWKFAHGTPLISSTWQQKAYYLGHRALQRQRLNRDWLNEDRFTVHLARMSLMLADHYYSGESPKKIWQDPAYKKVYANTKSGQLNQQLDEHNIGVSQNAARIANSLPVLRQTLPAISRHKGFKKRSKLEKFRWQDKAYELSCAIRQRTKKHGFFGINMASTGCGKTFANGRIMYGLADEKLGCRFSVALGLRTLTLQTGDALRQRLNLAEDDLAVLIGSQAVQELHELNQVDRRQDGQQTLQGSESAIPFFTEEQYVSYNGALDDGRIGHWLKRSPKAHKLLSAPVLVCTIDHLIPATESERGGKQIVPMLRLLTADLILDEPDDFDLDDLPALARLVNWAAMLGARVLLSSATLPPALVENLFMAYRQGREVYQKAVGEPGIPVRICCAWFDEYGVAQSDHADRADFITAHKTFVQHHIQHMQQEKPLRLANWLPLDVEQSASKERIVSTIAQTLADTIPKLHQAHHEVHPDPKINKKISVGLIRMANINHLVAIARELLQISPSVNQRIHYCIYHSQHPLAVRSYIEQQLDNVLKDRQVKSDSWWQKTPITRSLTHAEENQIFVVLATPVAEVGRDHDYDWAIAEPSSMRSLIQLAGRVQRHRQRAPEVENMLVWTKNYRALAKDNESKERGVYCHPGFEHGRFRLNDHDMRNILPLELLRPIRSISRIQYKDEEDEDVLAHSDGRYYFTDFIDLEHMHLKATLFGCKDLPFYASRWWENQLHWSCALQRVTPFRANDGNASYILYFEEEGELPKFHILDSNGYLKLNDAGEFKHIILEKWGDRVEIWPDYKFIDVITSLAEQTEKTLDRTCRSFGEIHLSRRNMSEEKYLYEPRLGVYRELS